MKRNLILAIAIAILFIGISLNAQSAKVAIKTATITYFDATERQDTETTMAYIYPKTYDIVSRDSMRSALEQMYSGEIVQVETSNSKLKKISKPIKIGGVQYAYIKAFAEMKMTYNMEDMDEESLKFMVDIMKMRYGKRNVYLEGRSLYVKKLKVDMYAVLDPAYDIGWTFLRADNPAMLEQILSTELAADLQAAF